MTETKGKWVDHTPQIQRIISSNDQQRLVGGINHSFLKGENFKDGQWYLFPRLERAAVNQAYHGEATITRYAIWADTLREFITAAISLYNSKHPADGEELLIKAANSVNAFAELQRFFEKIDKDKYSPKGMGDRQINLKAQKLSLTPEENIIAVKLLELEKTPGLNLRKKKFIDDKIQIHLRAILNAYAAARGWQISHSAFPFNSLSQEKNQDGCKKPGSNIEQDLDFEKIDGQNLWARTKTYFKLNRRPVAIVTEPNPDWNWFEDTLLRGMVIKWGRLRGFCVRYPTDFPSWSLNTNTPLIEITRARD